MQIEGTHKPIEYYQDYDAAHPLMVSNYLEFSLRGYRKHGPVFRTRLGSEEWVILAGPQANEFVWKNTELWDFPILFPAFGEEMGFDHVNILEGEEHRKKRALLKPAFDQAAAMRVLDQFNTTFHEKLAAVEPGTIIELICFWCESIARGNTRTVAQMEITDEALKRLVQWEREMNRGVALPDGTRQAHYNRPYYLKLKEEAMELMGRLVDERLPQSNRYQDNYAAVLASRLAQDGPIVPRQTLIDDLYYIVIAAIENTARTINWTAAYCWLHLGCLEKVRAEVDAWDGKDLRALSQMPFLKAVIMETHRVRPPAFFVRRHPKTDFEFEGHLIPKGTNILHANVLCHFLDDIYEEPFTFKPDRFIEKGQFVAKTYGFFGGGTHICLGRNHALMQTPVALAQMLKYYDLEFVQPDEMRAVLAEVGRPFPTELLARLTPRVL